MTIPYIKSTKNTRGIACLIFLFLATLGGTQQEEAPSSTCADMSLQEQLKAVGTFVTQGLSAIEKPVPNNPYDYDMDTHKHTGYSMKYRKDAFLRMDEAIKSLIKGYFEKGMSLDELIEATIDGLRWSEWPASFSAWERRDIAGVLDSAMTEKEWMDHNNEVVIFYKSCDSHADGRSYMFQNSFRAKEKSLVRAFGSFYGCVTLGDDTIYCDDLYSEYYYSPGGSRALEYNRILFGFLEVDVDTFPRILTSLGPAGRVNNFEITIYRWNSQYSLWEGATLWASDGILHFEYNDQTMDLTYYECLEPHPDRPDTFGCPSTINLHQYYLEYKEEIEQRLQPRIDKNGDRVPSFFRPQHEIYEERARQETNSNIKTGRR